MEFYQLESFISVVKYKSFSKAAEKLYLSQPTVSNNIQNLEGELETTLLDRKNKTITLTDAGKVLYKFAVELINVRDNAKCTVKKLAEHIDGELELDASSIPEQCILPHIIKQFTTKYPEVIFTVNHKNSKNIVNDILEGKQNFGIVGAKYNCNKLNYINFYEDELVLAVPNSPKYRKYLNSPYTINKLLSERFIFRKEGSGTRHLIEEQLFKKGINLSDLNVIAYIDSNEMIKKMVELKLGVSFMSKISIKNEVDLKLIIPIKISELNLTRNFYFVHCKNRTLPPAVKQFKKFLIEWSELKQ